jgi:hypothetical protein
VDEPNRRRTSGKRVLSLQRMIKVYVLLVRVDQGKRGILKIDPFGTD